MILEESERIYLRGLNEDPRWQAIMKKLQKNRPMPRFKPGEQSYERWIYESGAADATDALLGVLVNPLS